MRFHSPVVTHLRSIEQRLKNPLLRLLHLGSCAPEVMTCDDGRFWGGPNLQSHACLVRIGDKLHECRFSRSRFSGNPKDTVASLEPFQKPGFDSRAGIWLTKDPSKCSTERFASQAVSWFTRRSGRTC